MNGNNKKKVFKVVIAVFLVLFILAGISYAFFSYNFTGEDNTISTSDVSIKFLESNKQIISLSNALPMSDSDGVNLSGDGNVFDFSVVTKAGGNAKIGYKLNIEKLKLDEGSIELSDDDVKIYLTDDKDNKLVGPIKISELDNYNLYNDVSIHSKDVTSIINKYRIRIWVDKEVQVKNWSSSEVRGYKFKIGVSANDNPSGLYQITYSPNGGQGFMPASSYKNPTGVLSSNTLTRGGYTFLGWSTTSDGDVLYNDGADIGDLFKNSDSKNITLYAVWKPNKYVIKYNSNGGIASSFDFTLDGDYPWTNSNGVYKSGNYKVQSSNSIMKSSAFTLIKSADISFDWAVSSERSYDYLYYTIYKDGVALSDTGYSTRISGYRSSDTEDNLSYTTVTKTLEPGSYTIEFLYHKDGSGDNGLDRGYVKNINVPVKSSIDDSNYTVGNEDNKFADNVYSMSHYEFKGWSKSIDGKDGLYLEGASTKDLEKNVNEGDIINLYAVWEKEQYNIDLVIQNGSADETSKLVSYNEDVKFKLSSSLKDAVGVVSCTNNQNGVIENNILTLSKVTGPSTCTVKFDTLFTTVHEDGTLIINEKASDISSNISKHGSIINFYDAYSDSNTYSDSVPWSGNDKIKSVLIGDVIKPVTTIYWFYGLSNMEKGDFTNLDTSNVTSMRNMFGGAGRDASSFILTGLDTWDTSNVTSMSSMFDGAGSNATNWDIGDISSWDTSKVTSFDEMFYHAAYKANTFSLDLSNWNVSNVISFTSMFEEAGCEAVSVSLNLKNWQFDTETRLNSFAIRAGRNSSSFSVDISNWNMENVVSANSLFSSTGSFIGSWTVKIPKKSGELYNSTTMLYGSSSDVSYSPDDGRYFTLDVDVSVTVQGGSLASGEKSLKTISSGNDVTFKVVPSTDGYIGIVNCTNGQTASFNDNVITVSKLSGSTVCTVSFTNKYTALHNDGTLIINGVSDNLSSDISKHGLVTKFYAPLNEDNSYSFDSEEDRLWYEQITSIKNVEFGSKVSPISTAYWFKDATYLSTGNFTNLDTSSVTDMYEMFQSVAINAVSLTFTGFNTWDTSNVIDMSYMFDNAGTRVSSVSLTGLDNWNTSSVTDMRSMFRNVGLNTSTFVFSDLSKWNTSKVIDMSFMFVSFGSADIGDLSNWDTSKVTSMKSMFYWYNGDITKINLSKWNTSSVTNMANMFAGSSKDVPSFNLNLSNWDTSKVTDMSFMFDNAGSSTNVSSFTLTGLDTWDTSSVTNMSNMFSAVGRNATSVSIGNLAKWNLSKVRDMSYMFSNYGGYIGDVGLSSWDVSNVRLFNYIFNNTKSNSDGIYYLDLSKWDISTAPAVSDMFIDAGVDATTWKVVIPSKSGSLTNTTSEWYGAGEYYYTAPASGKSFTFSYNVNVVVQNGSLASGEGSSKIATSGENVTFNVIPNDSKLSGSVSCTNNQTGTFNNNILTVSNLTSDTTCTVAFEGFSTVLYSDGTFIFNEKSSNRDNNIATHGKVTKEYAPFSNSNSYVCSGGCDWYSSAESIKSVKFDSLINPTSTYMWFGEFVNLSSLDLTNLDTSEVTNMSEMFLATSAEVDNISFDLSSLNTSNVTSMSNMFSMFGRGSSTIDIGDLTNWDTSKVTDMSYMFENFGNENTKMSSIGRLNIPNNVNFDYFLYYASSFVGSFIINGYVYGEYALQAAATVSDSRIDLYYNSNSDTSVSNLVRKYGPDSDNHGNIYAIELTS